MTAGHRTTRQARSAPDVKLVVRGWPDRMLELPSANNLRNGGPMSKAGESRSTGCGTAPPAVLQLAAQLLAAAGELSLAGTLQRRRSKTARASYLSNGCQNCDAIQGNFPLSEEFIEWASHGGKSINDLSVLALGSLPEPAWRQLVDQTTTSICALA
jgi:hypothetical protein